jgi:hypothetical protein
MLRLTSGAAAVLAEARLRKGLGRDMAVRISPALSNDGRFPRYELHFTPAPRPDDVEVVRGAARVFLAAEVVQPLASAVLDTDEGGNLVLKRGAAGAD